MSNIIPPLLSDSPPPIITVDDEEDEFGDFNSAVDVSYTYENLSLPSTPQHEPLRDIKIEDVDINSNTDKNIEYKNQINGLFSMHIDKDFQDKRKSCDIAMALTETDVNLPKLQCEDSVNNVNMCENDVSCNSYHKKKETECLPATVDGVLPNKFVPIDTTHNHFTEGDNTENTTPEFADNLGNDEPIQNFSCVLANVPCSSECVLDNSKETNNRDSSNTLCTDCSLNSIDIDKDDTFNSKFIHIDSRENGAIENQNNEEDSSDMTKEFYFAEEPPDLHVIDESKVQVEDFHYYDAYDNEQELESRNFDELHKGNYIKMKIENSGSSVQVTENFEQWCGYTNACKNTNLENFEDLSQECITSGSLNDNLSSQSNEHITSASNENNLEINTATKSTNKLEHISKELELNEMGDSLHHLVEKIEGTHIENDLNHEFDTVDNFFDINELHTQNDIKACSETNALEDQNITTASNFVCEFEEFAQFDSTKFSDTTAYLGKTKDNIPDVLNLSQSVSHLDPVDDNDEFGDFGDYTQTSFSDESIAPPTATVAMPKLNNENILRNAEKILLEMYPVCEIDQNEFVSVDVLDRNMVFKRVKDVTETNALMYQWPKSKSQDKLLNALSIDTRNILYGPSWNPMMPKYAANLGLTPLEPMKSSDISTSASIHSSTTNITSPSSVAATHVDIPSAQFDWSDSGLINPLDCQTKENLQKTTDEVNVDTLEKNAETLTPVLRARFHSDNESVKSLQLTADTTQDPEEISYKLDPNTAIFEDDSFNEFTSYQSHKPTDYTHWANNTIPLRETHISGSRLPEEHICSNQKQEKPLPSSVLKKSEDDEFTDFQMSVPEPRTVSKPTDESKTFNSEFSVFNSGTILQPQPVLEPLKPMIVSQETKEQTHINWPNPGLTDEDILNIELTYSRKESIPVEIKATTGKSSEVSKVFSNKIEAPKQNVLEDVTHKPCIPHSFPDLLQIDKASPIINTHSDNQNIKEKPQVFNNTHVKHVRNWSPSTNSIELPHTSNATGKNDDDDDWSDFVCNPEPIKYPAQSRSTPSQSEKVQTGELRLSVPHLSQLQQPKKPIPVITPQGLIQTRIPSNISNLSNIKVQQPSSIHNQTRDTFQPCIITHQYQNHMNRSPFIKPHVNGFHNGMIRPQIPLNQSLPQDNTSKTNNDDDDWTDFISSPPVQQAKKPAHLHSTNTYKTSVVNHSSALPNIITNPVHFDYSMHTNKNNFSPHARNTRKPANSNLSGPATIPSISALPDLDFVAPKNRTFTKK